MARSWWVTRVIPTSPTSSFFLFPPRCPPRSRFSPSPPQLHKQKKRETRFQMVLTCRLVVVGDVHGDWDLQEDGKALQFLQADLVLFTGDFGEENVQLVRSIADLKIPKVAILGNHDCWYTSQFAEKRKDPVQRQLECLGERHVGYSRLDFPTLKLSVVGGRPFSCGGEKLFRKRLLSTRYGVSDMVGSANKICEAALGTPSGHCLIFLAHNGPKGLGSQMGDICGKDWVLGGGDHGDPDLEQALSDLKKDTQLLIPLVVFGHMHKELAFGNGFRKMIKVGSENTIYLNGAIVPRVKHISTGPGTSSTCFDKTETAFRADEPQKQTTLRAFTLVDMQDGSVEKIAECWVSVCGDTLSLKEESILFQRKNEFSSC